MSISCPNKRLKIWKDLVQNVGENKAYVLWAEHDGVVPDNYYVENTILENKVSNPVLTIEKVKENNINEVMETFRKNGVHFKKVGNNKFVGKPSDKFDMFKLKQIVETNTKRAQQWIDDKFNNSKYSKNWIKITENKTDIEIEFKIPKVLEDRWIKQLNPLESKQNLNDISTDKDQFGKIKVNFNEEKTRYEYSEEIKQIIFKNDFKNITAKEALFNILDSNIFDKKSKEYELIQRMIISTKATIKIVDSKDMKSTDTYMQYNTVDNTIELSLDNLGNVTSIKEGVEKFLHEVFHDRTLRILRTPKNASEQELYNSLKSIYDALKPSLEIEFKHEMSSLEEFTAGMFGNKDFEKAVENLINIQDTFWDKLKLFFRNLFGLSTEYDNFINQVLTLVDVTDDIYSGKDTLESKYNYNQKTVINKKGLKSISENIDKTLSDLENITKRSTTKNVPFEDKLKNVRDDIDKLLDKHAKDSNEYRLESIKVFMTFMKGQLHGSNLRLNDPDITGKLYEQVKVYNDTFKSLQSHIDTTLTELKDDNIITSDEYLKLSNEIDDLFLTSSLLDKKLLKVARNLNKKSIIFKEQYKDVLLKYENTYRQEGKTLGLTKNELDEYVNKKLSENRELIQKETDEEWDNLVDSPLTDISSLGATINSEKDFTNPIIRVFSRILDNVKHTYQNLIQPKLLDLQTATETFLEGNRLKSSDENYKNLVEWSKDGEGFLVGEYQIGFRDSFNELMNLVNSDDFGKNLTDNEKLSLKKSTLKTWFKENTFKENDITKPKSKWKTDLSKLSQKEQEYLKTIQDIAKESNDNFNIQVKSLKKTTLGVDYYRLPSQHKETITHLKKGSKNIFKEIWNDTFKLRTDDTTQGETDFESNGDVHIVHRDLSGKEVNYIPIHYRGKISKSQQSIDLATIYALELQNSIKFREKTKVHTDLKMFIDVIQENGFVKKQGFGKRVVSYFNNDGTTSPVIVDKQDAYLIKQLETMLNNRFYDKTSTYLGKIGNADAAKIEGFVRGLVSRTSQAINFVGAPANLLTGKSQTIMEVIRDPNLTMSNIKNAEKFFFKHIGGTIDDVGRNIYKSLPNQLLMSYGGIVTADMIQNNFEKNKALSMTGTKPLFFMQEGGEHWIQSIHTMTILDGAKILDKNGNYLDKEGNITTRDKAASVLDISVLENGKITTSIKTPFYTTIDRMKEYNKGGNSTLRSYIQSSLIKTQGQYSTEYQSELQRKVLGKAIGHFKKHIISPGLSRWRGFGTNAFAKPEDVVINYESDLLRPDEGNYVTWVRFLTRTVAPKISKLQFSLINKEWKEMDDWEKGNIVKTFTELAYIMVMANLSLLAYGAASDDDDYDIFWYIAAITRRNQSDAAQFFDVNEAWRVLKNPISSLKFLESSAKVIGALSNYVNPMVEDRNDKLEKASKKMIKYLIPGYGTIIDTSPKEQFLWSNR